MTIKMLAEVQYVCVFSLILVLPTTSHNELQGQWRRHTCSNSFSLNITYRDKMESNCTRGLQTCTLVKVQIILIPKISLDMKVSKEISRQKQIDLPIPNNGLDVTLER